MTRSETFTQRLCLTVIFVWPLLLQLPNSGSTTCDLSSPYYFHNIYSHTLSSYLLLFWVVPTIHCRDVFSYLIIWWRYSESSRPPNVLPPPFHQIFDIILMIGRRTGLHIFHILLLLFFSKGELFWCDRKYLRYWLHLSYIPYDPTEDFRFSRVRESKELKNP